MSAKIKLGSTKGRLTRNMVRPNQDYLKEWDQYQLQHLNADANAGKFSMPTLLPVVVGIENGIMVRDRMRVPQLQTVMGNSGALGSDTNVAAAVDSYIEYFVGQDGSQSSTPPTPLDLSISRQTVKLFYLKHDNWTFTDHTQFSVDNVPQGVAKNKMFDVIGTVDNDRGLLVLDHNWSPKNLKNFKHTKADDSEMTKKQFAAKYNLHVSIFQELEGQPMRTDIIIDPWGDSNGDIEPE